MPINQQEKDQEIDLLKQSVISKYPALKKIPFILERGAGKQYSETYPADERDNPNPGRATIRLHDKTFDTGQNLETAVLGEALHLLGQQDEKFKEFKNDFIRSMDPEQIAFAKKRYE